MEMIGRIRRMHARGKQSEREISRATGLSRNTVSKWLHEPMEGAAKYERQRRATKLTPYHEVLTRALKVDAHRPKRERRTARALHAEIKEVGYAGGYTRVTDFIRAWRQGEGQGVLTKAFVPLTFELGEAFQFDWSEEGLVVGGIYYRMQVAHMKLCASRAFWLVAYSSQGHEMLLIAWPVAAWLAQQWLQGFDVRIALTPWPFAAAGAAALAIAWGTVGWQALWVARSSPIAALRHE